MAPKSVLVTGANGYIGNAVARAFRHRHHFLARGHLCALPPRLNALISTTEDISAYVPHFEHTIALLRLLALSSTTAGTRPLVIFTSGCKDYGVGHHFSDDPALVPHTEASPINAPPLLGPRAINAPRVFDHADAFAPVLVRPTNVFGRSASYYAGFFQAAEGAARARTALMVPERATAICHAMHVDECGDAYVAIAEHGRREEVEGQVFNISGRRTETVDEIMTALAREYDIDGGVRYVSRKELADEDNPWPVALIDFPQWTSSEKLRRVTG